MSAEGEKEQMIGNNREKRIRIEERGSNYGVICHDQHTDG